MNRRVAMLALVAAGGTLAATAFAASSFPTSLTLQIERNVGQDVLYGKVRSKEHACEAGRKVKLKHRAVKHDEESTVFARPRTNRKGKWTFKAKPNANGDNYATPGYYHVKAGEKRISTGEGEIVCKEKYSSALFIGS